MAPQTHPRAQRRRRSSCPSFLCILILAWAVLMVSSNIARVLMLPEFFVRAPPRDGVAQPPNYYQVLGVSPTVDSATLRKLRTKYTRELHPVSNLFLLYPLMLPFVVETPSRRSSRFFDALLTPLSISQDKVGNDPEAMKTLLVTQEAFETLQDPRRRCEYDKAHRIRGMWPVQTCRDAFREEYRQIEREMYEKYLEVLEERNARRTSGSSSKGDGTGSSWWTSEGGRPKPEKRSSVPPATVKVEDDRRDAVDVAATGVAYVAEPAVAFLAKIYALVADKAGIILSFLRNPFRR